MVQNSLTYETLSYLPKDILYKLYDQGCVISPPNIDNSGFCYHGLNEIDKYSVDPHKGSLRDEKIKDNYPPRLVGIKIKLFEEILSEEFQKKGRLIRPGREDKSWE